MKRSLLTLAIAKRTLLTAMICGAYSHAYALPFGEQVQAGMVDFTRDARALNIQQSSQKAIVNWQSFSIAAGEAVRLNQPNQGVALFRVLGSDPSQIFGQLSATGQLFLSNPNGVLFGAGAQVNVGSLVATTMRMHDRDFLNGNYHFFTNPTDLANSSVVNQGIIKAEDGGYLVLLGSHVENSGSISANKGSVVLGSAQSAVLDLYGDGLVRVKLDGDALSAAVKQSGFITADGGAVQLATHARSAAINVEGVIQANSLVERNGVIRLEGGKNAKVSVNGVLSVAGKQAGSTGGRIEVTGEQVALFKGAKLDASGDAGGGTALVGGDFQGKNANVYNARTTYIDKDAKINVDATNKGNGGKAIVWADNLTRYYGNIAAQGGAKSGNGGFVEVSGKQHLDFIGAINVSASNGLGGNILLDPQDIVLNTTTQASPPNNANGTPDIAFAAAPAVGTTTIQIADVTGYSELFLQATRDITVASAISMAVNNSIRLEANNNINVNGAVATSGTGRINLKADADNTGGGNVAIGANITSQTGGVTLAGANITRTAGNIASTGAATALNGGNINLVATTGAINLGAATVTSSGSGAATAGSAGNITLSAVTGISGTAAITSNGGASIGPNQSGGNGGIVSLNNTGAGMINVGAVTANGGNSGTGNAAGGNAGSITVANSGGNITTGALTARTGTGIGTGANSTQGFIAINNTSVVGTINTAAISTAGNRNGHGGNVNITGNNAVTITGTLSTNGSTSSGTRAGRNAGSINIAGVNRSITGAITANGGAAIGANQAGGHAAVVSITGTGTLNTATINAQAGAATGTGSGGIAGSITASASALTAGALTTTGNANSNGGNIAVTSSAGNMTLGAIASNGGGANASTAGRNAGSITLNSAGLIAASGFSANGSGANGATLNLAGGHAANITLTAVGGITATTFSSNGGAASSINAKGGNAGSINLANSGAGNITATTLTAQAGVATGTGTGGAAGGVSVVNTAATGNLIVTDIRTAGNTNANGGNAILSALGNTTTGTITTSAGALGAGSTSAGRNAGTVSVIAGGNLITGAIAANGGAGLGTNQNGGAGGTVNLDAGNTSTITMNNISSVGGARTGTGSGGAAGNITVADNALLSANATVDASGGSNVGLGGIISFGGTINSTGANRSFIINNNSLVANSTVLSGAIGNTLALSSITTNAIGNTSINGGAVTTTGAQTYNDAVTTSAATTFTTANSDVVFNSTIVAGGNTIILAGTGVVTASNSANNFSNLAVTASSANIRDSGAIVLGATNVTGNYSLQSGGLITQSAPIIVGGTTTLNSGTGVDITLNNAANNFNNVTVASARDVSLVDADALTLNASNVRTIDARALGGNLTLGGNVVATGDTPTTSISLSTAQNFINTGNFNLTPGAGKRWLVYSSNQASDTRGAILTGAYDFKQYNTVIGGPILGSNDGFIYSTAPSITAALGGTSSKVYNANTTAPIGALTLTQSGAINADTVVLSGLSSASFDNKNVGTSKLVTSNNGINIASATSTEGKPVFGYQLASTSASGNVGSITQANISAVTGITANNKIYNANTSATLNTATAGFTGIIASDVLNVATATGAFVDQNAATGKTVNITGLSLGGTDAGNYALTSTTASTTANITTRPITVTASAGQFKIFGAVEPLPFLFSVGGSGLAVGDNFTGALNRQAGELVGNYAINQGSLAVSSNYQLTYVGSNFAITQPVGGSNPRNTAGLVDLNPAIGNYTQQPLFVLDTGFTAAGEGANANNCATGPESLAKDKDFALMLNFGLKLPEGVNAACVNAVGQGN